MDGQEALPSIRKGDEDLSGEYCRRAQLIASNTPVTGGRSIACPDDSSAAGGRGLRGRTVFSQKSDDLTQASVLVSDVN